MITRKTQLFSPKVGENRRKYIVDRRSFTKLFDVENNHLFFLIPLLLILKESKTKYISLYLYSNLEGEAFKVNKSIERALSCRHR
jgi:hypothetical protein